MATTTTLEIAHFNDVYRVRPFKLGPTAPDTIDCTQFAALLAGVRDGWPDGTGGLTLFSGDVFSPSVESSVTRGSHMVPVLNHLAPDVALTGNHDFDFGYPQLTDLVRGTRFPWLLSNVVDRRTGHVPEHLREFVVLERAGVRIGIIGLVEEEWIGTVSNWPPDFEYRDMAKIGLALSERLRDPAGEHRVDLIIALTHARVPNDLALALALNALSPRAQQKTPIAHTHGADLLLGGHDHLYFVSKGADVWHNFDLAAPVLGAEADDGRALVVKSGTDFRDLSAFALTLADAPPGSVRRRLIARIEGRHLETRPDGAKSEALQALLKDVLADVGKSLGAPVAKTAVPLDVRSHLIRTAESAAANWFADIVHHAYDGALCVQGRATVDAVLICAGMLRGDSVYGPGDITLGDILEILPFEDPLVVLELPGAALWAALEASLSTWPAQEGRFPVLAGARVRWDSRKPRGERVLSVTLLREKEGGAREEVDVARDDTHYVVLTREYMAQGHDGFTALQGHKYLVDDESGQMMSAIVRKYLLGSAYVHRLARKSSVDASADCDAHTARIVHAERIKAAAHRRPERLWRLAASRALHATRAPAHYRDHIGVAEREHMHAVDGFEGGKGAQKGAGDAEHEGDLLTIHPEVDGRLEDVGRA